MPRALRLAPASEAQTFRIVQEALTNVRKHAAARRAMVSVDARRRRRSCVRGRRRRSRPQPVGASRRRLAALRAADHARTGHGAWVARSSSARAGRWTRLELACSARGGARGGLMRDPAGRRSRALPRRRGVAPRRLGARRGRAGSGRAGGHRAGGSRSARPRAHGRAHAGLYGRRGDSAHQERSSRTSRIVMLTVSEDEDDLFGAIKAGAQGYLLKNLESQQLRRMLDAVAARRGGHHAGDRRAHPGRVRAVGSDPAPPTPEHLTDRETRRPAARHGRASQQGDRRPAGDQREHRQVPPAKHRREAPRAESNGGRRPSRCVRGSCHPRSRPATA